MSDIKIDGINDVKKLLQGEHESQQKIQVAVPEKNESVSEIRKVGDRWVDSDGYEWEQKDGYKIKLGKAWQQELQSYLKSFPNCPKEVCTCGIPNRLDEKMKMIHGMCFDCVITMEHKIKLMGKWDEYQRDKLKNNAYAWLKEAESDKNLIAEELSKAEFINDFGDLEKWNVSSTKEEILQKIEEEFEKFKNEFFKAIDGIEEENTETNDEGTWRDS